MKKFLTSIALGLLAIALPMNSQTIYDGAKIAGKDLNGTARFVGMGGAMSALGGDISVIGTNPAGMGIFRSNDVSVSFGLSSWGNESDYIGNKLNSDKIKGSFDNAGFVLATKVGNATTLRYVNFGFNYKRAKSFYKNTSMWGNLGDFTQTDYMAAQAYGIKDWSGNLYTDPEVGWLSALGYDGALITDKIPKRDPNADFSGLEPFIVNGVQVKNLEGNPMYITPGEYGGMFWGGTGDFRSEERGGIDQYDFNLSFNFNDRVYVGFTVGAYDINYSKYTYYSEDYGNEQKYHLESWNRIDGAGFDFKLGAIVRPFEESPFRIGLAIHTPTFYNLKYKTNAKLESDVLNDLDVAITNDKGEVITESGEIGLYGVDTYDILNGDMIREFQFRTPWTYNVSLGYTIGNSWALGAEYEYQDYSSMKFKDVEGYSDAFELENSFASDMLKGVHSLRLGAEYKIIPQFALRAGYNYTTAAFKDDAFKDLAINSIQTDTDFANAKSLSNYTVGIGYRGSMFYADLAYKFSSYKEDFYPFINADINGEVVDIASPEATKVKNTRSQVLLTLGLRF